MGRWSPPSKGNPMEKVLMASKRECSLRVGMSSRDVAACCSIVKRMGDANEPSGRLAKLVLWSRVCWWQSLGVIFAYTFVCLHGTSSTLWFNAVVPQIVIGLFSPFVLYARLGPSSTWRGINLSFAQTTCIRRFIYLSFTDTLPLRVHWQLPLMRLPFGTLPHCWLCYFDAFQCADLFNCRQ